MSAVGYDVVVVAGGVGSRLGGAVKADLTVDGERLLDRVLAATGSASTRVLVGRGIDAPDDVVRTLEDPPSGGPAAGTDAGLQAVTSPARWTLLLASDLADPAAGIATLLEAAARADEDGEDDVDGICLAGDAEHPQWLFGIHRTAALRGAVESLDTVRNRSMKALLSSLRLTTVAVDPAAVADIDTPTDARTWQAQRPADAPREPRLRGDAATVQRWRQWVEMACEAVAVDPDLVDVAGIHVLTKQVAHGYDRPLAPVSSYVLGLAVGAAQARGEEVDQVALRRAIVATIEQAPPVPEEQS
ncbi:NTP transferase domain-containing protein [Janibacter melonis]|uniref:NTP transferase domain-containing protein n=1 Tax=Janibacter melonis TaxID=262209 RepID=UPI001780F0D3|nr:hypothetical protein [Janibacter melonis]